MAPIGKLRMRDGKLVVEGMTGEVLAQVEPDDNMRVEDGTQLWKLMAGPPTAPVPVTVSWMQMPDRDFIDTDEVIDVKELEQ